jgi:hypothetical protein
MKLTTDRKSLATALGIVKGVVPAKSSLPILTHVLLTVRDGKLEITSCDLARPSPPTDPTPCGPAPSTSSAPARK